MEFKKHDIKIYLVCGKARHGKDTVAEIIKSHYEGQGLKAINDFYSYYMKDYAKRITGWSGADDETKPREFLQQFGTNLVRNQIDDDLFINRMIEDIKIFDYFYDVIIISDGRLVKELDRIRDEFHNVTIIRVNRPNFDNGLTEEQKKHITETGLDNYSNYDYVIENDSTIESLKEKVEKIIMEVK